MLCNCTMARCLENNTVEIVELKCEPPLKIKCANGLEPIAVPDDDLCCWHWECDCVCTGWGDPHYLTFDGTYYSYQGNCTYALVEEITKKIDNFGVYIDNYDCGARDRVSCPRDIIVRHETQTIRIAAKTLEPAVNLQIVVNNEIVATPYKKYGVKVYRSGINYVVEIPELEANITYNGLSFSVKLPYRLFRNNTQGQCGTCTNNQTDDCLTKSGEIISNCEIMADTWVVEDPRKPTCGSIKPTIPPKVTDAPCKPSSLCELILGTTFQQCHKALPPEHFYQACIYDSCHVTNSNIECSSVQQYAQLCADQGVCVQWRDKALECPITCPSHKVYNACGPAIPKTCQNTPEEIEQMKNDQRMVEGCFCPFSTQLFSLALDVCVSTCGCVGPDNLPRQYGQEFQFDCQDCVCREGGSGIICQEHKCPNLKSITCELEGFYPTIQTSPDDACCNKSICKCEPSKCTSKSPNCGLGYEVIGGIPDGHCCPIYKCSRKKVCVHGSAEYLPGAAVLSDRCQTCLCTEDDTTDIGVAIQCTRVTCSKECPLGFELKESKTDCCGECEQTQCVINDNNNLILLKNKETMRAKGDNCTVYSCNQIKTSFISSTSKISCSNFNEAECEPDTIELLPDGCCKICIQKSTSCELHQEYNYVTFNNCRSIEMVRISRCEGTCNTYSMYSAAAREMSHKCTCCQEVQTAKKRVTLRCEDGSQVNHDYVEVQECNCVNTNCGLPQALEEQTPARARRSIRNNRQTWT